MRMITVNDIAEETGLSLEKIRQDVHDGYLVPMPNEPNKDYIYYNRHAINYIKFKGEKDKLTKWRGLYGSMVERVNNIFITSVIDKNTKFYIANTPDRKYKIFLSHKAARNWCLNQDKYTPKMKRENVEGLAVFIHLTLDEIDFLLAVTPQKGRWAKLYQRILRARERSINRKQKQLKNKQRR